MERVRSRVEQIAGQCEGDHRDQEEDESRHKLDACAAHRDAHEEEPLGDDRVVEREAQHAPDEGRKQRSSAVISGHHRSSAVISGRQWSLAVISGH
jgi:hypothetical protein